MNRQTATSWNTNAGIFALVAQLAAAPGAIGAAPAATNCPVEKITAHLSVAHGPVNGVLVEQDGRYLAVYGWPNPKPASIDQVLITHRNREVACAGMDLVRRGVQPVIPESESFFFLSADQFWEKFKTERFHDYKQQNSHILAEPLRSAVALPNEGIHRWQDLNIRVISTPGITTGAVSYAFQLDEKRVVCVGDLIYGDGKLMDLYGLQDRIPETNEDGYHGYAARAADVLASLHKIGEWQPDMLIPAHGPVINNPRQAIDTLTRRLRAVFASHFANDALRWYRGDEKLRTQARRILGDRPVSWMPMAETIQTNLPDWIMPIRNSRLIVSKTGAAFMCDCGNLQILRQVMEHQQQGRIKSVEGLYISHYHDDHTDRAQSFAEEFHCPIYTCREMKDVLEHPGAYRLPALTANPIKHVRAMADGATRRWHEFTFTYSYFPGQTMYHGGLLVRKDGGESIFFIGDSFGPSGLDDYCLLNRNLLPPEKGYGYCLEVLRRMKPDYLLINQHIPPAFRFSSAQLDSMNENFRQHRELLAELFPWDDPNYGVDAQWARLYPYGSELTPGKTGEWKAVLLNHSPFRQTYRVTPHLPAGWRARSGPLNLTLGPRREGSVSFAATPPPGWKGTAVLTADVAFGSWVLREWIEALVTIKPAH